MGYNLARVKEACGALQAAEAEYRALLANFPQYGDCCLRLAYIAKERGDVQVGGEGGGAGGRGTSGGVRMGGGRKVWGAEGGSSACPC